MKEKCCIVCLPTRNGNISSPPVSKVDSSPSLTGAWPNVAPPTLNSGPQWSAFNAAESRWADTSALAQSDSASTRGAAGGPERPGPELGPGTHSALRHRVVLEPAKQTGLTGRTILTGPTAVERRALC